MDEKEKAIKLVQITFGKIADASAYRGVHFDGGKKFSIIEGLSKKIAINIIEEIVNEIKRSDDLTQDYLIESYLERVVSEIANL